MSFRTVVVESRCKLEYSLNYLICRKAESETKIVLDEIKTIIINSNQVTLTTYLIAELIERKIKVIFTDKRHNPVGEITPYYNNYYSYKKIKEQISLNDESKDYLWMEIVRRKIYNQALNLNIKGKDKDYEKLIQYSNEVVYGDVSNREGHAAKVYFNSLFGKDFNRNSNDSINKYLNYGYSIILSSINREIKAYGYLTEIGIHHIGESNPFNLSCDLMEPLRPYIDSLVIKEQVNDDNFKIEFVNLLAKEVKYNGKVFFLDNAIKLYVEDLLNYLKTGDIEKIRFIEYVI